MDVIFLICCTGCLSYFITSHSTQSKLFWRPCIFIFYSIGVICAYVNPSVTAYSWLKLFCNVVFYELRYDYLFSALALLVGRQKDIQPV